jgi:hypothetical protein
MGAVTFHVHGDAAPCAPCQLRLCVDIPACLRKPVHDGVHGMCHIMQDPCYVLSPCSEYMPRAITTMEHMLCPTPTCVKGKLVEPRRMWNLLALVVGLVFSEVHSA